MTKELNQDYFRILCGSAMPYELARFYKAIERCDSMFIQLLGLFVPDDIKPYLIENISSDILFCENSHEFLNSENNSLVYQELLKTYIY
ncbi:hypothetical protein HPL003_02135 [Paenibacillus terrae HPL-003]|uniref:Uncharacterized protein n=1 Tax=Paenibacillus terrae (strain HPL-003) TaxID=985665 RepID=G7VY30_PAETH|nr:hypothetical protein HPL003_02135 [Paenibacillus terrae HPL-003]